MKKIIHYSSKLLMVFILVLLFNNCGQGFTSSQQISNQSSSLPTSTPSASPSTTPTSSPSPSPSSSPTPIPTPSISPSPTPKPTPSATPSPKASPTPSPSPAGSYSTTFSNNENPISENGAWINNPGASSWNTRVRTTGGNAFGDPASSSYNDSVAYLAGSWGTTQTATATVYRSGNSGSAEIELLFRATWDGSRIYTYECDFIPGGLQIAKWNGVQGDYLDLPFTNGTNGSYVNSTPPQDNEVISATVSGDTTKTTIKVYQNGKLIGQADDTKAISGSAPYVNGSPGIGFDVGSGGTWNALGFRDYSITTSN